MMLRQKFESSWGYNKGHNLALIANYLVREHAKTDGKTSNN